MSRGGPTPAWAAAPREAGGKVHPKSPSPSRASPLRPGATSHLEGPRHPLPFQEDRTPQNPHRSGARPLPTARGPPPFAAGQPQLLGSLNAQPLPNIRCHLSFEAPGSSLLLAPLPRAPSLPALHLDYCSLLSEKTHSTPWGVLGPPLLTTGTRHTAEVPSVFVYLGGLRPPRSRSPPSPRGPSIVQCSTWPRAGGQEKTLNGDEWCFSPHQGNEEGLPPPGRPQGRDVCDSRGLTTPEKDLPWVSLQTRAEPQGLLTLGQPAAWPQRLLREAETHHPNRCSLSGKGRARGGATHQGKEPLAKNKDPINSSFVNRLPAAGEAAGAFRAD